MNSKNTDYHQSPAWQRSLDLAAALYELVDSLKGPAAGRLATQLTAAAARLPARVAQAGGALVPEAEGLLLELETLLLLAIRLGAGQKGRIDAVLIELAGLQAFAPAPIAVAESVSEVTEVSAPTQIPKTAKESAPVQTSVPRGESPPVRKPVPIAPPPRAGVDRLLVDGHNFLGRAEGFMLGSDASRDQLLARLQDYVRKHPSHRVTTFFDGNRTSIEEKAGIEIRYSSGERSADDAIVNFVYALSEADRKRSQLVTDDRELADRARNAGVRRQPVSWLEEQIGRKKPSSTQARPEAVAKENVGDWQAFFSGPPQRPGRK